MAGDAAVSEQGFAVWAGARRRALLRTGFLLSGDQGRAEDLVQDALVKVRRRWRQLADGNPEAYARQVMARQSVSWWRQRRREVVTTLVPDRRVEDRSDEVDRRVVVGQALARLAPRQRAVIVLRFYHDLTEVETAAALGVSVGTVKRQTHAALARLRASAPELSEYTGSGST